VISLINALSSILNTYPHVRAVVPVLCRENVHIALEFVTTNVSAKRCKPCITVIGHHVYKLAQLLLPKCEGALALVTARKVCAQTRMNLQKETSAVRYNGYLNKHAKKKIAFQDQRCGLEAKHKETTYLGDCAYRRCLERGQRDGHD
jgi:hypothetical protein